MFALGLVKKYLWPQRRSLGVSLISVLSVILISLVVWLNLLFFSITEGIEQGWLQRLTQLNAPIRVTPTAEYYRSYYYQIDRLSSASSYTSKSIGEKQIALVTDPYEESIDEELPYYFPQKRITRDLVKDLYLTLDEVKNRYPSVTPEEYEITGTLLKLQISNDNPLGGCEESTLTQAAYISSLPQDNDAFSSLLLPPTPEDLMHLYHQVEQDNDVFLHANVHTLRTLAPLWTFPASTEWKTVVMGYAQMHDHKPNHIVLTDAESPFQDETIRYGQLTSQNGRPVFITEGVSYPLDDSVLIYTEDPLLWQVDKYENGLFFVHTSLQGEYLQMQIPFLHLEIIDASPTIHFSKEISNPPPWTYTINQLPQLPHKGVLLPRQYRENRVHMGDTGLLSYSTAHATGLQEDQEDVVVSGFYDPGVLPIGHRMLLLDKDTVRQIDTQNQTVSLDPLMGNGIWIWHKDIYQTQKITEEIRHGLQTAGIDAYWSVTPFYEYPFARDLIQQFQSDRYLFTLIGLIILIVACSGIISLLLLLVHEKTQEIGIYLSLGATKWQIASVFGLCGACVGVVSCLFGSIVAYFTLKHIDKLVYLLSALQGQSLFNSAFYGDSLPNQLSHSSVAFLACVTPLIATLAGLIPAIKACRLKPAEILRSQ